MGNIFADNCNTFELENTRVLDTNINRKNIYLGAGL